MKGIEMKKECSNCAFWDKKPDIEAGRCLAKVPNAALIPTQGIGGQTLSVVTYWPETRPSDRCGEWAYEDKPKPETLKEGFKLVEAT